MERDLDICGLGNGLMDLQCSVSDQEIKDFGLFKGEMRLVDKVNQTALLKNLKDRNFTKCSGGSAANTIIALAEFGGKAAYSTVLGNDEYGHYYSEEFKELGIKLISPFLDTEPTGTCLVLITPDSERTMYTCLGATAFLSKEHLNDEFIARTKWLYLEGYNFCAPNSTEALFYALNKAKEAGTKVALTFSDVFIIDSFNDNLKKVVPQCDLIFCNENEAKLYTGKESIDEAYITLCSQVPNVALTMGAEGSLIHWEGKDYKIPSYPANLIDTTGAGDMFAGAFMYGINYLNSAEQAGHLASLAAAKVVSQMGARMKENYKDLINQVLNKIK